MFNDEICTAFIRYSFTKGCLNLFCNGKVVVDWKLPFVQFHDSCPFRGYKGYVILDFMIDSLVVHVDALEGRIEQVAQQAYGTTGFFVNQCRKFGGLLYFDDGFFPMFQ